MKNIFFLPALMAIMILAGISFTASAQWANTSLSNLVTPTSVNQSLLPSSTNSKNLGSSTLAWKDGWFMGKVGLGTTSTPSAKLHVKETTSGEVMRIEGVDPLLQFYEGGLMGYLRVLDGDMYLTTNSSNNSGKLNFGTQSDVRMSIHSDGDISMEGGDVSIGVFSGTGKLHVQADGSTTYPQLHLHESTSNETARLRFTSLTGLIGDQSAWDIAASTTNSGSDAFTIQHLDGAGSASTFMMVNEAGKVGINTVFPNSYLHVNAPTGEDAFRVQINSFTKLYVNSNGGVSVGSSTVPPSSGLYVSGNAGFGTSAPAAKVHVSGTDELLRLSGTSPTMYFQDGTSSEVFLQANGSDMRLGTKSGNSTGKLVFRFNGADKNAMDKNGNMGIGTLSPGAKLHLKGSNEVLRIEGSGAFIQFYNGTVAKSYIFRDGDDLRIGTSTGNTNGKVAIGTTNGGDQLFVLKDGSVSIGTSVAKTGYKLSVEGKVVCRELKVETAAWPDYVFTNEYKLPSLKEVEASIQQHKHLPGIPSAKELEANGVEVGEMQRMMMQKIEELTLYVIDLEKKNDALSNKVTQLESR